MVDIVSNDSFVPQSRHDILVESIIIRGHGGYVCDVGEGNKLRLFFGTSRKGKESQKKDTDKLVDKNLEHERESQKKEFER